MPDAIGKFYVLFGAVFGLIYTSSVIATLITDNRRESLVRHVATMVLVAAVGILTTASIFVLRKFIQEAASRLEAKDINLPAYYRSQRGLEEGEDENKRASLRLSPPVIPQEVATQAKQMLKAMKLRRALLCRSGLLSNKFNL
eukprot:CAMPEP_0170171864 /NCGR_PEP_ID=MMETSP0040_2-20121228/5071_1 /TAXON_ID=641309 /ORGANISM="Lotharella oceanica, Strain CCMP622" /LENGTH=142 /DNA_ID=CAMNT_0010412189 /DNA_START=758 /DNA_END=1187 /DNA_ORIENTATION=+